MNIEIKILNKTFYNSNRPLPVYATHGSAALDLVCTEDITIAPQERLVIPTGLAVWAGSESCQRLKNGPGFRLPLAALILPRSGLGAKGLVLANTVGLIDEDYQGELKVVVWNTSLDSFKLQAGDRFAQMMFISIIKAQWNVVEDFSDTTGRGEGGFGSSGN